MDGYACRMAAHRFLQNFFGLLVASISEIDIGFGHRIHIACSIELARGVRHGGGCGIIFAGVNALSAAGAKKGVRLQATLKERTVHMAHFFVLAVAGKDQTTQQYQQAASTQQKQRVVKCLIKQASLLRHRCRHGGFLDRNRRYYYCSAGCESRLGCRSKRRCHPVCCRRRQEGGSCCHVSAWTCRAGCGRDGSRSDGGSGNSRRGVQGWSRQGTARRCRRGRAQFIEIADIFGQICHAAGGVFGAPVDSDFFFGRRCCLGLDDTAGKRQLVRRGRLQCAVFNRRLHFAADLTLCADDLRGGRTFSKLATKDVEVLALGNHCPGFAGEDAGSFCTRNIEHRARFDDIDIATDEGIRIASEQGRQHLVQRYAGRFAAGGNPAGSISGPDNKLFVANRHFFSWTGFDRWCFGQGRGSGCSWSCWGIRAGRSFPGRHCCTGCRRPGDQSGGSFHHVCSGAQLGRIKQHGVVAGDSSGGPVGLQNQIHKRLSNGPAAAQAQIRPAVSTALQSDFKTSYRSGVFKPGGLESFGWRDAGSQAGSFFCIDV